MSRGSGAVRRRQAWRFGRAAEAVSAGYLRLKGYRILARGVRTPVGELDIVARRGRVLAVVEVKARGAGDAAGAVSRRQKHRIVRATEAFLRRRPALAGLDVRFDVMLVRGWGPPRHVPDAWRLGEM